LGIVFFDWYAVPDGKSEEIVAVNTVLSPGKPESHQVPLLNPAQDGHFADTAVSGDSTGGEIFRVAPF
jgi:hypothetical protein